MRESLDHNAPLSLDEIRKRLDARKERCTPTCKGWEVIDSDAHGLMIQRCDECFIELYEDFERGVNPGVYDSDVAQLPEALDALAVSRAEVEHKPMRLVFTLEVVTDVGFQAIENSIRRALDEADGFTYSLGGCVEYPTNDDLRSPALPRPRRG